MGLEVKNLSTAFVTPQDNFHAVRDVSFTLRRGEVLGLVGESGCGKSMTALSLLRLLPPGARITEGEMLLHGRDLLALNRAEMRRVRGRKLAAIFQDPHASLNPVRSIGTQFIETLQAHLGTGKYEAQRLAAAMLARVGLPAPEKVLRRFPFQLSGGMKQRVIIALALSLKPEVLIADEPTTALDVTVQAQVLSELNRLKDEFQTGIILISHNMGVIARMSDRVAVMYGGTIVESGPVSSVFETPAHPYTRGLLGSIPRLEKGGKFLQSIKGQPPGLNELNGLKKGCSFAPRCDRATKFCVHNCPPVAALHHPGAKPHTVVCHHAGSIREQAAAGRLA